MLDKVESGKEKHFRRQDIEQRAEALGIVVRYSRRFVKITTFY